VTVFPARNTDHQAVAVFDHREIGDRFAHPAQQFGFCLVLTPHN
jgi:hypothetical protein